MPRSAVQLSAVFVSGRLAAVEAGTCDPAVELLFRNKLRRAAKICEEDVDLSSKALSDAAVARFCQEFPFHVSSCDRTCLAGSDTFRL